MIRYILIFTILFTSTVSLAEQRGERGDRGLKPVYPVQPDYESLDYQEEEPKEVLDYPVLPKVDTRDKDEQPLSQRQTFLLQGVLLKGNTILTKEEVANIVTPYIKQAVTIEQVHELRQKLSWVYANKGYVNSGVILPDQTVNNGVITFKVIEGTLNELKVTGNKYLKEKYITGRIKKSISDPLNVNNLQLALKEIERDPNIRTINAQLKAGNGLGQSILDVHTNERSPWLLVFSADNYRSPGVGAESANITFGNRNLTGWGDSLTGTLSASEGFDSGSIQYSRPITLDDTRVSLSYASSQSLVIEEPFDSQDIEGESESFDLAFSHPWIKDLDRELSFSAGLVHKKSDTTLFNVPFSFSAGAIKGSSAVTVVNLGASWSKRSFNQVWALRGTLKVGVDALNATQNADDPEREDELPDGSFTAFLGQAQWARKLPIWDGQVITRGTLQFTPDPLMSLEKFAIGGHATVRGYRENQFLRDNGITANFEARFPLGWGKFKPEKLRLSLLPFIDVGRSWDNDTNQKAPEAETISSVGIGLLWNPINELQAELYLAEGFDDIENGRDHNLQDDGIHFSLSYQVPF